MNNRSFLYIVILTFLTVAAWVVFDILHSRSQITTPTETQKLIEPISPTFEIEVLK